MLFDPYPLCGKRVLVYPGRRNVGGQAWRSLPSDVGQGGASPQSSGEAEPALGGRARQNQSSVVWARSVEAFLSDWKRQRSMVINSTSLGTPVLGPR